jgi:steroid delta-isomerase-like uncharacterized protein
MLRPLLIASGLVLGLTISANSAGAAGCNEQLFQEFLAGWSHDLPKLMATLADDVVYEDKTVNANLHGKKAVQDFAQGWFNAAPDIAFTSTSMINAGNRGAIEWIGTGTQKGDLPGMPASNKVFKVPGVSVIECADGKITHDVDYWDNATFMRQLGFLPAATQ